MKVVKHIMHWVSKGVKVYYITGNHDEMLRKFVGFKMGSFRIVNKLVLELDNNKKAWFFHGDVFDATTKGSAKLLAKLGGQGYDLLILINRFINWCLTIVGREKMSLSKKVKNSVKKAVKWISNFEQTAAELAIEKKYDFVICGHIHQPQNKIIENEFGKVTYLNSGDWIENLTALEFENNEWQIYQYNEKDFSSVKENKAEYKVPELNVITDEVTMFINSLILPTPKKARKKIS